MIAALLLLLAPTSIDGLPLGALPRQDLPRTGCAAYLFTTGPTRAFAAMAGADALRIALDGKVVDIARAGQSGMVRHGLSSDIDYRAEGVAARLSMTIADRADLTGGAQVTEALLTLERPGKDTIAVPLAGLVGCAA
jgi:hypothetical protein